MGISARRGESDMTIPTPQLGCSHSEEEISRRTLIGGLVAAGAFTATGAAALQPGQLTHRGTPQLTIGPFYPLERPPEEDPDLTRMMGRLGSARGTVIEVTGRVLTEARNPVPAAHIDMWQANSAGRYHHPSDPSGGAIDPSFQGAALLRSDSQGRYRIRTVIPGPYGARARHIHFDVRGRNRRLITQMFFPGEQNAEDNLFRSLRDPALQSAVTASLASPTNVTGVPVYEWDIVLAGE
jgi:protocatechuate 3,4-dioxygenase, beta subunit